MELERLMEIREKINGYIGTTGVRYFLHYVFLKYSR
jgi:hypothetical protein